MISITALHSDHHHANTHPHRAVALWLYAVAALIFAMVIVGGATRLTDSGLSITEWKPLLGAIPPLSEAAWQEAFAKYQTIPEYQLVNRGMSLAEFKVIYWWEWAHRFLGRIIGLAFVVPLAVFWARGQIKTADTPKFLILLVLGGLQGFLGWYMVKSGLVDRVDVSQYRLAAHLGLAIILFGAILWVAFRWGEVAAKSRTDRGDQNYSPLIRLSAIGLAAAVYVQIILGAFVAGLDAGKAHNTWPLMDGEFIPSSLGAITPLWRDIFENVTTVQFNHRLMAYAIVLWGLLHAAAVWRRRERRDLRASASLIAVAVSAQMALGVWTVIAAVPLGLGLAHQAGAVILFGLTLYHLHVVRPQHA